MYPNADYGVRFGAWIRSDTREPYNSYGNGAAMRVSPCAWVMSCGYTERTGLWPVNARKRAQLSAEVTHNHPEGIKGALAITGSIAEAAYGIPEWIKGKAYSYMDEPLKDVLRRWKRFIS